MSAFYKRSAIHNLTIEHVDGTYHADRDMVSEGLALPRDVREASDILVGEAIVVARINGSDNWRNRVRSIVIDSEDGSIEARGSLAHFLSAGDLVCVITETLLDPGAVQLHAQGELAIVDYGIAPGRHHNAATVAHERVGHKDESVTGSPVRAEAREAHMPRIMLQSIVLGLRVNKTDDNCLHGSAEIPGPIMDRAGLVRHRMVTVFNASQGGCTETYAVPMAPGVVMTTGAMARFAPIDTHVHVAAFEITSQAASPVFLRTDGSQVLAGL